jgi:hypothetical protein
MPWFWPAPSASLTLLINCYEIESFKRFSGKRWMPFSCR